MVDTKKQKDYSEAARIATDNLNKQLSQKPGEFKSEWQKTLNDTINKIQNREKFNYDLNGDALYQQYKDQYTKQGQLAMMDTIGQASAMTGGYGNSYAQSVGQQTFQGYLQNLNDKVPELYQAALDRYNQETQDLYNQYGLYADREDADYAKHRDSVADYTTERDYLTGRVDNAEQYEYQTGRDAVTDEQWNKTFEEGVRQYNETSKVQQEQWKAEFGETVKVNERNYQNQVKQIEEDIRHNKITEEQGQQQIDNAKAELRQRQTEAQNDYDYKMASLAEEKRQYNIDRKDAGYSELDELIDVKPTTTAKTSDFIANNYTKAEYNRYEFNQHGNTKTFEEVMDEKIKKLYNEGSLTEGEIAELIRHYGL